MARSRASSSTPVRLALLARSPAPSLPRAPCSFRRPCAFSRTVYRSCGDPNGPARAASLLEVVTRNVVARGCSCRARTAAPLARCSRQHPGTHGPPGCSPLGGRSQLTTVPRRLRRPPAGEWRSTRLPTWRGWATRRRACSARFCAAPPRPLPVC